MKDDKKPEPPELLELRERWANGHTRGCLCQSRGKGGPCRQLRLTCVELGFVEELYDEG